jgi:hypothetical protein
MPIEPVHDLEDFFDRERRAKAAADARIRPEQAELAKGDYFVRQSDGLPIPIYGQVLKAPYRAKHMQGYRFTKCYSQMCPDGEMGDIRIRYDDPLTKEFILGKLAQAGIKSMPAAAA